MATLRVHICLACTHFQHLQRPHPAAVIRAEAGLTVCMTSLTGVLPWALVLLAQIAA